MCIDVQAGKTVPIGAALAELEVERVASRLPAEASSDAAAQNGPEPRAASVPASAPPAKHAPVSRTVRMFIEENGLDMVHTSTT